LDVAGIVILLGGYVPLILQAFAKFSMIQQVAGRIFSWVLVVAAVICSALIGIGLIIGSDALLWVAVTISTVVQATLIYFARRKIV